MTHAVTRNPDVMHGQPCITGTRIPTLGIYEYWQSGVNIEHILWQYPALSYEQVKAAIAFEQRPRQRLVRLVRRFEVWLVRKGFGE